MIKAIIVFLLILFAGYKEDAQRNAPPRAESIPVDAVPLFSPFALAADILVIRHSS